VRVGLAWRDVSFSYPSRDRQVLRSVSLSVRAGQTLALVGHSGSGKSTLMALLLRWYDVTPGHGDIAIDGKSIYDVDLHSLRAAIGHVSQEPLLLAGTVAENIAAGCPGAGLEAISAAAVTANADGFIRSLPAGYHTEVGERGTALSAGQKQRVAIARALVSNPSVLLLDEWSSALDGAAEAAVADALRAAAAGRTTVVAAHRLSTVVAADAIAVLADGAVIETGTHAELLAAGGSYAAHVRAQAFSVDTATVGGQRGSGVSGDGDLSSRLHRSAVAAGLGSAVSGDRSALPGAGDSGVFGLADAFGGDSGIGGGSGGGSGGGGLGPPSSTSALPSTSPALSLATLRYPASYVEEGVGGEGTTPAGGTPSLRAWAAAPPVVTAAATSPHPTADAAPPSLTIDMPISSRRSWVTADAPPPSLTIDVPVSSPHSWVTPAAVMPSTPTAGEPPPSLMVDEAPPSLTVGEPPPSLTVGEPPPSLTVDVKAISPRAWAAAAAAAAAASTPFPSPSGAPPSPLVVFGDSSSPRGARVPRGIVAAAAAVFGGITPAADEPLLSDTEAATADAATPSSAAGASEAAAEAAAEAVEPASTADVAAGTPPRLTIFAGGEERGRRRFRPPSPPPRSFSPMSLYLSGRADRRPSGSAGGSGTGTTLPLSRPPMPSIVSLVTPRALAEESAEWPPLPGEDGGGSDGDASAPKGGDGQGG